MVRRGSVASVIATSRWGQAALAGALFVALDLVWLTLASRLYHRLLGDLLAADPRPLAAAAFYALFVVGLTHFVIHPAVAENAPSRAAANGALFGLVAYATWDLTNLAVIEGFPMALVPIDLAWGTVLASAVSTGTVLACRLLSRRGRARP